MCGKYWPGANVGWGRGGVTQVLQDFELSFHFASPAQRQNYCWRIPQTGRSPQTMQEPGKSNNPDFPHGYPAANQDQMNPPPPPYYPPVPGPQPYGPSAPPVPSAPYYQPYYPTSPYPQQPLICQQSTNVTVVNPQNIRVQSRHSDYLCWSILNFLCCCWPLGIAAIVFSCKTRSDDAENNERAAACSSKTALYLNIISMVFGIVMYIVIFVLYLRY
uniref:Uncharacterized protein n=1 Tax=Pyxicephalus adspersus TaxID=30357 RepID=A0AAV2ZG60_PYXAD|nr:TPA: hypothetical protein GDO54_003219 [Pyxicephalus adspersus]